MILRRVAFVVMMLGWLASPAALLAAAPPAVSTAVPTPPSGPTVTPTSTIAPPTPTSTALVPTPTPTPTPIPSPSPTSTPITVHPKPHHHHKHHYPRHHKHHHKGSGKGSQSTSAPAPPVSIQLPTVADLRAEGSLGNGSMPESVRRWAYLILPAARANGIPAAIIAAVIMAESGGNPLAWNPGSDAHGLMQILNGPWDPSANIDEGASLLAGFKQEFGTWKLATAAYNAGPGAVNTYHGVPPYPETEAYVVIVQYYFHEFSSQPLSASSRYRFRSSLSRFHHLRTHIRYLRLKKGQHRGKTPGLSVLPDGCDSSGPCHPRNLPHPIRDPFWPLGGPDPLPPVVP